MAMSSGGGGGSVASTPNVTPMIDVMLVLLIIFMVVTPMLLAGFNATPPIAVNLKDHPEDEEQDQVLGIDKDGAYFFQKKPIRTEDVGPMLNNVYSQRVDDFVLYLKADKDLPYGKIQDAMEIATKNKVRMVALITEQKAGTISTVAGDTKASVAVPGPGGK